jgi:hypothetical protein
VKTIRTIDDFKPGLPLDDRRINVDPETRRIAVRVARWDETHSGFGEKVRIPRKVNVDAAHVGVTELGDGVTMRVATLPMETMHAPRDLASLHAASWYENSGKGLAKVRYSVDDEGIRADGVLFDDVDDATIDRVLAASASGDWRSAMAIKRFSDFEHVPADFVGSCIVNVPGFSDTFTKATGQKFALAASAHTIVSFEDEEEDSMDEDETTTVTAGGEGEGCDGTCESCGCGAIDQVEPAPTVTLSASAVAALLAGEATDEVRDEVQAAMVAGGLAEAPDPAAARLDRLEKLVTGLIFND